MSSYSHYYARRGTPEALLILGAQHPHLGVPLTNFSLTVIQSAGYMATRIILLNPRTPQTCPDLDPSRTPLPEDEVPPPGLTHKVAHDCCYMLSSSYLLLHSYSFGSSPPPGPNTTQRPDHSARRSPPCPLFAPAFSSVGMPLCLNCL